MLLERLKSATLTIPHPSILNRNTISNQQTFLVSLSSLFARFTCTINLALYTTSYIGIDFWHSIDVCEHELATMSCFQVCMADHIQSVFTSSLHVCFLACCMEWLQHNHSFVYMYLVQSCPVIIVCQVEQLSLTQSMEVFQVSVVATDLLLSITTPVLWARAHM